MKQMIYKRKLAARILLSAFVPMLVCLSLHTHHYAGSSDEECYECVHHLRHQGHISIAKTTLHDCLLCEFAHVSFIVATIATILIIPSIIIAQQSGTTYCTNAGVHGLLRPRGPPSA